MAGRMMADVEPDFEPDPADAGAWGGTGRSIPVWIDDDGWDEKDIPQRPWVVPGFALRGAVTLLSGPPSALKSTLMLSFAAASALGRDFGPHFRPCAAEHAIVYNVEDDRIEQRRRLSATLRYFGAKPADIRGKVIRVGPK
jgi:RecA-family ATPase